MDDDPPLNGCCKQSPASPGGRRGAKTRTTRDAGELCKSPARLVSLSRAQTFSRAGTEDSSSYLSKGPGLGQISRLHSGTIGRSSGARPAWKSPGRTPRPASPRGRSSTPSALAGAATHGAPERHEPRSPPPPPSCRPHGPRAGDGPPGRRSLLRASTSTATAPPAPRHGLTNRTSRTGRERLRLAQEDASRVASRLRLLGLPRLLRLARVRRLRSHDALAIRRAAFARFPRARRRAFSAPETVPAYGMTPLCIIARR